MSEVGRYRGELQRGDECARMIGSRVGAASRRGIKFQQHLRSTARNEEWMLPDSSHRFDRPKSGRSRDPTRIFLLRGPVVACISTEELYFTTFFCSAARAPAYTRSLCVVRGARRRACQSLVGGMSVTERERRRRRSGLGAEELNGEMRRMGEKEKERGRGRCTRPGARVKWKDRKRKRETADGDEDGESRERE